MIEAFGWVKILIQLNPSKSQKYCMERNGKKQIKFPCLIGFH